MRKSIYTSVGLQLAGAVVALLLTSSVALAQSGGSGENPLGGPAATPPPATTPAATPAPTRATTAPATGTVPAAGTIKPSGLFLEFQIGANLVPLTIMGVYAIPMVSAGFVIGFKAKRLLIGLRLDLSHVVDKDVDEDPGNITTTTTSRVTTLIFSPTVQYHIIEKGPFTLFVTGSFDFGPVMERDKMKVESPAGDMETETEDDLLAIGFSAGFGFRYFIVPNVGLSVVVGLRGMWVTDKDHDEPSDTTDTYTMGVMSIFTTFGVVMIW